MTFASIQYPIEWVKLEKKLNTYFTIYYTVMTITIVCRLQQHIYMLNPFISGWYLYNSFSWVGKETQLILSEYEDVLMLLQEAVPFRFILDANRSLVSEEVPRVLCSFTSQTRSFLATERHVQVSYQPTIAPHGANLKKEIIRRLFY